MILTETMKNFNKQTISCQFFSKAFSPVVQIACPTYNCQINIWTIHSKHLIVVLCIEMSIRMEIRSPSVSESPPSVYMIYMMQNALVDCSDHLSDSGCHGSWDKQDPSKDAA